jgi:hypothetical protein
VHLHEALRLKMVQGGFLGAQELSVVELPLLGQEEPFLKALGKAGLQDSNLRPREALGCWQAWEQGLVSLQETGKALRLPRIGGVPKNEGALSLKKHRLWQLLQ